MKASLIPECPEIGKLPRAHRRVEHVWAGTVCDKYDYRHEVIWRASCSGIHISQNEEEKNQHYDRFSKSQATQAQSAHCERQESRSTLSRISGRSCAQGNA